MRLIHWRRPLRDGGVEFFMRAGDQVMSGTVLPDGAELADALRAMFEGYVGLKLPDPELKRPRGGRSSG